jgi:hypothetical protein
MPEEPEEIIENDKTEPTPFEKFEALARIVVPEEQPEQ